MSYRNIFFIHICGPREIPIARSVDGHRSGYVRLLPCTVLQCFHS